MLINRKLRFLKNILKITIFYLIISNAYTFFTHHHRSYDFVLSSNEWIFNCNISQYSSIVRESLVDNNRSKLFTFESTIVSDLPEHLLNNSQLEKNLKCAISTDRNKIVYTNLTQFLSISLMPISIWKKSQFYRVECELNAGLDANISVFKMAVVDTRYLVDSVHVLHMQTPIYVNTSRPKAKAVASCVHMLRNLTEERVHYILDWLNIQKNIGVAKVRIYLMETNELLLQNIETNYKHLVEIVDYKTELPELCHLQLKNKIQNPNSDLLAKLYDNCVSSFEKHFNMTDMMVSNSHERLQSNDCFLKFKYNYEFVVNYDIDEFILPRHLGYYSNSSDFLASQVRNFKFKYNFYEFIRNISDSYQKKQVVKMFNLDLD